jgi:hypothetical protein
MIQYIGVNLYGKCIPILAYRENLWQHNRHMLMLIQVQIYTIDNVLIISSAKLENNF